MNILRRIYCYNLKRFKNTSMKMKVDKMASIIQTSDPTSCVKAAEFLMNGQVIAVPTDTIYGLACNANCPEAIMRLYAIKGRDSKKPVAICVSNVEDIRKWGEADHLSDELLHSLLPGPVTLVLEKTKQLSNPYLNPQTTKIGIRIPNHNFINCVTKIFDMPVALTSANLSNEPSTLSVTEFEHLFGFLGAVFDGGVLNQGLDHNRTGSTVIDLSNVGFYNIIRRGISYKTLISNLESYGLNNLI